MARRRGGRGFSRQVRRKFVWARSFGTGIVAAGDVGLTVDLLEDFKAALGSDILGCTVMRIRGEYLLDQGPVAESESQIAVVGIRTFTEPLDATEELPLTTPHADWMSYEPLTTVHHPGDTANYKVNRRVIDVKSSRKMEELGEGLGLFVEHNTVGVAAGFTWALSIGLKLP